MIDHPYNDLSTIIIDNSPVEFAIISPDSWNRGVIVKSENAGLDLIGAFSIRAKDSIKLVEKLRKNRNKVQYNRVKSSYSGGISFLDERKGEFWFVWKGFASEEELQIIQNELENRLPDILLALEHREKKHIEWSISSIATLCAALTSMKKEKIKRTKIMIVATIVYAVVIAFLFADGTPSFFNKEAQSIQMPKSN